MKHWETLLKKDPYKEDLNSLINSLLNNQISEEEYKTQKEELDKGISKNLRQQGSNYKSPKNLKEQGSKYKKIQERKRNPPKHGSPEELEEINQLLRDKGLNV
tara:strand:+ start:7264 stop:7572 length:309 start_codon:yes stop_codon:yes gene_type:complete